MSNNRKKLNQQTNCRCPNTNADENNTKINMFLSKNINSIVMAPSGNELEEISKNLKEHNTRKRADVTVLVSDKKIDFKLKKDIHSDLKSN